MNCFFKEYLYFMATNQPIPENEPKFKWWHIMAVAFIGIAVNLCGTLLKLLSHPNSDLTLVIGFFILVFCCLLGIIKLIFFRSKNSRFNR